MCGKARSFRARSGDGAGEVRRGHAGGRCRNCTCGDDRSAGDRAAVQAGDGGRQTSLVQMGPAAIALPGGYGRGN